MGKRLLFVVFVLMVVIQAALYSLVPYFYREFINTVQLNDYNRSLGVLIKYTGLLLLALFLSGVSYWVGDIVVIDAAAKARQIIFKHVQDLDFAFHTSKSTGSLISAFKRGDSAFFNLFHSLHFRVIDVLVGSIVMMVSFATLHWTIGVVALITFLISIGIARFTIRYNLKTRSIFNDREDDVSAVIVDNMVGFETVKLFAKEDWERNRLAGYFAPWRRALYNFGISFRYMDYSVGTVVNLSIFLLLYLSLQAVYKHDLTVGDFIFILAFLNVFYQRLFELIWGLREIAKNYSDIERYFGILENEIAVKDPATQIANPRVNGEIEFNNVNFAYRRRRTSIKNFDLKIRQGESVALVGRSGAGKTTIVKLLMRFYDVNSGEILVDGINIKNFTKSQLRSFIGVVPQEPVLFNNTIEYNIAYGNPKASKKEIKAAARMAYMGDFIDGLPEKYATHVGERGIRLSGGQKQRLAIARMILSNPKIVIFDEATSHLDSESESLIQEAFWKASRNKTTVIIAHRLSTVMKANRIVVMDRGGITEIGTHKELINKKKSLYKYFWDIQVSAS